MNNSNSTAYKSPMQEDEKFVERFQTIRQTCILIFLSIILIPILLVLLSLLHISARGSDSSRIIIIIANCVVCVVSIFILCLLPFAVSKFKETTGLDCFITSKRLYIKLNTNDEYKGITQDEIKSLSRTFAKFHLAESFHMELKNGETITLPHISPHKGTFEKIQKLLTK